MHIFLQRARKRFGLLSTQASQSFFKQRQLYHNLEHTIQKMYIYAMYACAFLTCSELSALVQLPMSQCICENLTMLASCVYLCINICVLILKIILLYILDHLVTYSKHIIYLAQDANDPRTFVFHRYYVTISLCR